MPDDIESIHTPAFVVNEAVALRNIAAFQAHCDKVGLDLRPHIKTHKSIHFAKAQLAAGAVGITCQKISEAEAMLADGIDDILITFNILGSAKLARLRALSDRISALSVVADKAEVVQGLGQAFEGTTRPLTVLVECDTGAKRCGVQTPNVAVELAKEISKMSGLVFGGLMTYPALEWPRRSRSLCVKQNSFWMKKDWLAQLFPRAVRRICGLQRLTASSPNIASVLISIMTVHW